MQVTSFGVTAELGFLIFTYPDILTVKVRPADTGLTITSSDTPLVGDIHDIVVTTWGVPASHEHDLERQQVCHEVFGQERACRSWLGGPVSANVPIKPFLSNPTSCGLFTATMEAESWEEPGAGCPGGCRRKPSIMKSARSQNANVCRSNRRSKCSRAPAPLNRRAGSKCRSGTANLGTAIDAVDLEPEGHDGHAAGRDDRQPRSGGGPRRVHPRTVRLRNQRLAAGGRLPP